MKLKSVYVAFLFSVVTISAHAQKAYDVVKYFGKADRFNFTLEYANGYIEASNIWVIDTKTNDKGRLPLSNNGLDTAKIFRFWPTQYIKYIGFVDLLNMNANAVTPPKKIQGIYYFDNRKYRFVLLKMKSTKID